MAIDSTLFIGVIPAGTYAVGDVIPMSVARGPSAIRDGYGPANLKRMFAIGTGVVAHITFKNSNWVDAAANIVPAPGAAVLSNNSNGVQMGHDADLTPNSTWEVNIVVDEATTTTAAHTMVALIDVDYPSVAAIANPKIEKGIPCSTNRVDSMAVVADGQAALTWTTYNVDILKAGSRYLMASAAFRATTATMGFFSISGAAGQQGLERIIPVVPSNAANLRYDLDYSTPLVKGPFNINYAAIGTAGTDNAILEIDWVKR